MQEFKLEDKDCAIILKENNTVEILVPDYEDGNEEVGIVTLLPTPEFQELVSEIMTDVSNIINEEE